MNVMVPAVAPSPDANALRIHVGKGFEILHAVALIGKLLCAHTEVQRRFESMAAAPRAAIVQRKDNVALLCHELVPKEVGAAPAVSNDLSVRPPIRVNQNGIFRLRMEVRRLNDAGVELPSVARFHGEKFHGGGRDGGKPGNFVLMTS